jgi:predicted nucleotidyltransferase
LFFPHNLAMTPSQALKMHRQAVLQIVLAHNATNARVFGSVSQGLDDESSDLDILVDPTPMTSLFDIGAIRRELKQLLGVKVDVLTPNALPDSFRSQVLSLAQPI